MISLKRMLWNHRFLERASARIKREVGNNLGEAHVLTALKSVPLTSWILDFRSNEIWLDEIIRRFRVRTEGQDYKLQEDNVQVRAAYFSLGRRKYMAGWKNTRSAAAHKAWKTRRKNLARRKKKLHKTRKKKEKLQ